MKAQRCPVCYGMGKIVVTDDRGTPVLGAFGLKVCHGCQGKGWVVVPEERGLGLPDLRTPRRRPKRRGPAVGQPYYLPLRDRRAYRC